jgi:hypothetical protein
MDYREATRPYDNGFFITIEWLLEIGFKRSDDGYLWINNPRGTALFDIQVWPETGKIKLSNEKKSFRIGSVHLMTRGKMRSLLDAFDISIKETNYQSVYDPKADINVPFLSQAGFMQVTGGDYLVHNEHTIIRVKPYVNGNCLVTLSGKNTLGNTGGKWLVFLNGKNTLDHVNTQERLVDLLRAFGISTFNIKLEQEQLADDDNLTIDGEWLVSGFGFKMELEKPRKKPKKSVGVRFTGTKDIFAIPEQKMPARSMKIILEDNRTTLLLRSELTGSYNTVREFTGLSRNQLRKMILALGF